MRELMTFFGKGLIMESPGLVGIKAEIELIFPAELKAGLGQGVVTHLGSWMTFGKIRCVRGDFIRRCSLGVT